MKLKHKWLLTFMTFAVALMAIWALGKPVEASQPTGNNSNPVITQTGSGISTSVNSGTTQQSNGSDSNATTQQSSNDSTDSSSQQPTTSTSQSGTATNNGSGSTSTTTTQQTVGIQPASEPTHQPKQVYPLITGITVVNANTGQEVSPTTQVSQETPLTITVNYDATGTNALPGDYFYFSLSGMAYQGDTSFYTNQGRVDLSQGNGKFTFTDTGSDAKGNFYFTVQLNTTSTTSGQTVPISVSVNGQSDFTGSVVYNPEEGPKPNEVFSKYAMNSNVSSGNVGYAMRINPTGTNSWSSAVISDKLTTPGFTYDKSSFKIEKVKWTWNSTTQNWDNQFISNVDVTPVFSADDRSFSINFGNMINADGDGYLVLYNLLYNGNPVNQDTSTVGKVVYNNATLTDNGKTIIDYNQTLKIVNTGGSGTSKTVTATVQKIWNDNDNADGKRPSTVTVHLYQRIKGSTGAGQDTGRSITLSADTGWRGQIGGLLKYDSQNNELEYYWSETNVPAGYISSVDGSTLTNTESISKTVTKVWDDSNNADGIRPSSVKVDLMNGNTVVATVTLNAANNWSATVNNLPKYDSSNNVINYTWQEENVPNGYTSSVNGDTITNKHNVTISETVKKVWDDNNNQDGLRPSSVNVELLNGTTVVATVTLNASNNWTATVNGLAAEGSYTWREVNVPNGYTSKVNGNTITNSHTPATTSVAVNKVWNDNNNQDGLRPSSVTAELMNGNKVVATVTLDAANNWTASVNNLPVYSNGQKINYTWREVNAPAGYTSAVNGNTITNSHTPETTTAAVNKVWNDNNNQDGLRPNSITAELLNGNKVVSTVTLDAANNWTASVNNLPVYSNGQKINYTWREVNVPNGYTSKVNGNTITNSHTPATTSVAVNKIWNDANNQDGLRPNSITAELLNGNKVVATVTLDAANNWTASVNNLPVYSNGHKINYTWREVNVPNGYTSKVNGNTITNSHTPATTSVAVNKVWNDNNNQDGLRPNSITAELLNGNKVVATVTLDAANNWTASVNNLPVYSNGQKINYTWREVNVPNGYTSKVNGNTITNSHIPATTTDTVKKVWNDANNQDGLRPSSITAELLNGNKVVATVTLDAANNWTASVNNLPVYSNGQKINYTWREVNVPNGYTSSVDGNVITNTHIPSTPTPTPTPTPNTPTPTPNTPSTPNTPVTPTPGQPTQPGQPTTTPVTPVTPTSPSHPQVPKKQSTQQKLPQTGNDAAEFLMMLLSGFVTLSFGLFLARKKD